MASSFDVGVIEGMTKVAGVAEGLRALKYKIRPFINPMAREMGDNAHEIKKDVGRLLFGKDSLKTKAKRAVTGTWS